MGLIVCLLGAVSFGLLGCISKIAERKKCNASALVVALMGWSTVFMFVRTLFSPSGFQIPSRAIVVAAAFGILGSVAFFGFQKSIEMGKVTAGWLMMNLSTGLPAVFSIWLYKEKLTGIKMLAFVLAFVALLLLFWGRLMENQTAGKLVKES